MNIITESNLTPKIMSCINGYLSLSDFQNLSIGIYKNGEVYCYNNKSRYDFRYDLGSITKTYVAHFILFLEKEKLVNISDRIDKYIKLPSGKYPTILQLLTHTSKFGLITPAEIMLPGLILSACDGKNIYRNCASGDLIKAIKRRKFLSHDKNCNYEYSDFSYAILALIIESALNKPFNRALQDFITKELGLKNTNFLHDDCHLDAVFRKKLINPWTWDEKNPFIIAGGLKSNLEDMIKYLKIQIESDASYIRDGHIPYTECKHGFFESNVCLGWHQYKKSNKIWHIGRAGAFNSFIIFNKSRNIGVVALGNSRGISKSNVSYIAKLIYGEIVAKKIKLSNDLSFC